MSGEGPMETESTTMTESATVTENMLQDETVTEPAPAPDGGGTSVSTLYELEDVRRVFRVGGSEVRAVDGVSLTIETGEFVAIEGPSGSGKSTMLQLLGALDRPSSGRLTFENQDLGNLSEAGRTRIRREAIGFVFQHFNLIPTLTAAENVEAAMAPMREAREARTERVAALLAQVGLAERAR